MFLSIDIRSSKQTDIDSFLVSNRSSEIKKSYDMCIAKYINIKFSSRKFIIVNLIETVGGITSEATLAPRDY